MTEYEDKYGNTYYVHIHEGGHMELEQESYEEFIDKMAAAGEAKIERIQRAVEELKEVMK